MLVRFCLYGILKNQRYFEPFLVLIFLEKGLSFFEIGLLFGFREAAINIIEIPSGAVADTWGRRQAMVVSFGAYVISFAVFGLATSIPLLFLAMLLFAIGEAFRSGSHKALIFSWLRIQDRLGERTKVYGYTRSWSKFGSASSVVLAALIVYTSDSFSEVFFFSIIPYLLGIINLLGYPGELDGKQQRATSFAQVMRHMRECFREIFGRNGLRRLLLEAAGFEGVFKAAKDYLQPVLKAAAIATAAYWLVPMEMSEIQQVTILVGPVYLVLHLLEGLASRNAHRVSEWVGNEQKALHQLWGLLLLLFLALALAGYFQSSVVLIVAFVALHAIQNLWRPMFLTRIDAQSSESRGATVLSIESQTCRTATMVAAPTLGFSVDWVISNQAGGSFWPVGAVGAVVALVFFVTDPVRSRGQPGSEKIPS